MKLNLKMMTAEAQSKISRNFFDLYSSESNDHSEESFQASIFNDEAISLQAFVKRNKQQDLTAFMIVQVFRLKLDIDNKPIYVLRTLNYKFPKAEKLCYKLALKFKLANLKKRVCILNHSMTSAAFARQEIVFDGFPNPYTETPSYEHYLINCLADRFGYKKTDTQNSLLRAPIWFVYTKEEAQDQNEFLSLYNDLNPMQGLNRGLMSIQFISLGNTLKRWALQLGILKPQLKSIKETKEPIFYSPVMMDI